MMATKLSQRAQNMITTTEDKTLPKIPSKDRRSSANKKGFVKDHCNPNKENVTTTNKVNKNKKDEKKDEVAIVNPQKQVIDIEDEPLLKPNPRRFVLFPIQFHEVTYFIYESKFCYFK
jgi:hypothetical protein